MKKYISPILSIILGILTFGMYAAPFFVVNVSVRGVDLTKSAGMAYDNIIFDTEMSSLTAFSVFSVILLILAGLMIVSGILLILNNCKVLKINWIEKANALLMIVSALIAVATMICYVVLYAVDLAELAELASVTVGSTAITLAVVSIVFAIATTLLSKKTGKKRK